MLLKVLHLCVFVFYNNCHFSFFTVVTLGFEKPEASFNESDGQYKVCIVKDKETASNIVVSVQSRPGTAQQNIGILLQRKMIKIIRN